MQMPSDANIPYEWQVGTERNQLAIVGIYVTVPIFCNMPRRRKGVQYTSLEAYRALTKEALGERQELVFKALEMMGRASDKELSFALGWPINTITPGRGELEEMGLIECSGEQLDEKTERHEMIWSVV